MDFVWRACSGGEAASPPPCTPQGQLEQLEAWCCSVYSVQLINCSNTAKSVSVTRDWRRDTALRETATARHPKTIGINFQDSELLHVESGSK